MGLVPAGGGHSSVARALSGALLQEDPSVTIATVNLASPEYGVLPLMPTPHLYAALTVNTPKLYRAFFMATNDMNRYAVIQQVVEPQMRRRFRRVLAAERPDVVVVLNAGIAGPLLAASRDVGLAVRLGVVLSDLVCIHPAWMCPEADWYSAPTEEAAEACVQGGVPVEKIHLIGQPVGAAFCQAPDDRRALRRSLGLPEQVPVVLVVGGGDGVGGLKGTVTALTKAVPGCHIVAIAGRNRLLRQSLLKAADPERVTVQGYVTNMANYMWAGDVMLTKAGPNTIMEAVHTGLPLVITGAIPGQEEANIDFVRRHGLGLVATERPQMVSALRELLSNPARVAEIRANMAALRRPEATATIARLILGMPQRILPDPAPSLVRTDRGARPPS